LTFDEVVKKWWEHGPDTNERIEYKKYCEKIVNNHIIRYREFKESPLGKSPKYKFQSHYFVDLKEATLTPYAAEILSRYIILTLCDHKDKFDKDRVKIAAHTDGNVILAWLVARYLGRPLSVFYSSEIIAKEEWEIDGNPADLPRKGDTVILIHDVGYALLDVMNACAEYARRGIDKLIYLVLIERHPLAEDSIKLHLLEKANFKNFEHIIAYGFMGEPDLEVAWKKSRTQRREE